MRILRLHNRDVWQWLVCLTLFRSREVTALFRLRRDRGLGRSLRWRCLDYRCLLRAFATFPLPVSNCGERHGSRSRRRRAWLLGSRSRTNSRMPRWWQAPFRLSPLELPLKHRTCPVVGGVTSAAVDAPFESRGIAVFQLPEVRPQQYLLPSAPALRALC